jgi:uncharacterized protein YktA (UPF0223 family)
MINGYDCTCFARSEYECACDADWTTQEVADLRRVVRDLERDIEDSNRKLKHFIDKCKELTKEVEALKCEAEGDG